jgi:hypothetical protein
MFDQFWDNVTTACLAALILAFGACTLVFAYLYKGTSEQLANEQAANLSLQTQVQAQTAAYQRANAATAQLQQTQSHTEARYAALQAAHTQLQRTPRLVATRQLAGVCADVLAGPSLASPVSPPPLLEAALGLELSVGTVWLYNAALTGHTAPVGACRPDAAAEQASAVDGCSQPSGAGINELLANHSANAKACQLDRERHQALIDFIKAHPLYAAPASVPPTP